ncbi:MAG: carboxypeptidase-like regulatory domain-containing protein [Gemmatimonadetes bacterium]|nr:carboxypeptidase-like regulatory domain-containing protein [Gemmatimonadota bacterium]
MRRIFLLTALLLPGAIDAQAIRGRVLLPDSTPLSGILVQAVRAGRDTSRALSSATGAFTLTLRGAGRVELSAKRIGHRPVTQVVDVGAGETAVVTLVAVPSPVELPRVLAARDGACRPRTEGAATVVAVWEQARIALEASLLAAEAGPIVGQWLEHRGTLSPDALVVRERSLSVREHPTTQVFRSVPPAALLTRGYVTQERDGIEYLAPDQQVLLSPEFSNSHCFSLRSAPGDTLIGVAFEPNDANAPSRIDIAGVVWLDRQSFELRAVDFRYTGPTEAAPPELRSGRVAFAKLDDGRWVVTSWKARLPGFAVRGGDPSLGSVRGLRRDTSVKEVYEAGGDAVRLTSGGRTLLERRMPSATVQLVGSADAPRVSGTIASVTGTNLQARADSTGRVVFAPLPEGRYEAQLLFPGLDSLGVPPVNIGIRAALGARTDTVRLPRLASLLDRVCGKDAADGVILRGTVRDGTGLPARAARIVVSFLRTDAARAASGVVDYKPEERRTRTDDRGAWYVCGIPRATDIVFVAEGGGGFVRDRLRIPDTFTGIASRHDVTLAPLTAVPNFDGKQKPDGSPADDAIAGRSAIGEFDARHAARTATQSLGPADLAKRRVVQTWQLLGTLRGVRVVTTSNGVFALSGRGDLPSMMSETAACPYVIVLDGVRLSNRSADGADLTALPPPERLHGIEVYAGGTRVPPLYQSLAGGAFCGVIGMWTKRE